MISSSLYQRVEFTFPAPGDLTGLNPFDTRDICLRGVMTDPHGTRRDVYGFADRDHRLDPVPGNPKAIERAVPTGPLVFRLRVSAGVAGRHDLQLWYEFRGGRRIELETVAFEAVPGNHPGHVRLGANGYASGLMLAEYPFGNGRFIVNTFNILENIDTHPAADRLLLNLIRHAARSARGPAAPLPKNVETVLERIRYAEKCMMERNHRKQHLVRESGLCNDGGTHNAVRRFFK